MNDETDAGNEDIIMPFRIERVYVVLGIHTINLLWGGSHLPLCDRVRTLLTWVRVRTISAVVAVGTSFCNNDVYSWLSCDLRTDSDCCHALTALSW